MAAARARVAATRTRNGMMPRMAAVVRIEFELKQGQSEDAATTALNGGIGALKLAIERGITGTAQTGVVQGSVQATIVEQSLT